MNPLIKLHLGSAAYCAIIASLNWFRSIQYSRQVGMTSESFSPVTLALLLSGGLALYLAILCLLAARTRLESGRKVKAGNWIESRSVVVYALPLLWHQNSESTWKAADGALATEFGGYGHALSGWVFVFTILGLLLFQILARLSPDERDADSRPSQRSGPWLLGQ